MTSYDPLLIQGIAAAKAGDKSTARPLLTKALRRRPDSETAWLWLSSVLDTPQGRIFCLQKVLAINPHNRLAQQGLATLLSARPATAMVAEPQPASVPTLIDESPSPSRTAPTILSELRRPSTTASTIVDELRSPLTSTASSTLIDELRPARAPQPAAQAGPVDQQRFWQIIVGSLAVIALCLIGTLAYVILVKPSPAKGAMAPITTTPTLPPRGTLRPTFTPTSTNTPTPTYTPTPTDTPTPTPTDTPTPTETPTPTPTPKRVRRPAPTPTPTFTPRPTLVPLSWDPRLDLLRVRIEPAAVTRGQPYWRLVDARWADEQESEGRHSIYVQVIDVQGNRALGQPVVVHWPGNDVNLPVEDYAEDDAGVNFPMYATLGAYAVSVGGGPSDRVVGLGLGTVDAPDFKIHTSFYLTFRWVLW